MLIDDYSLRNYLRKILDTKTRNQIVKEIQGKGYKFHQYNIDRFLAGKPVSLDTAKKLDNYVYRHFNGMPPI
jgi:DNA-binding winged helix-turn-helix (wHTH) protein